MAGVQDLLFAANTTLNNATFVNKDSQVRWNWGFGGELEFNQAGKLIRHYPGNFLSAALKLPSGVDGPTDISCFFGTDYYDLILIEGQISFVNLTKFMMATFAFDYVLQNGLDIIDSFGMVKEGQLENFKNFFQAITDILEDKYDPEKSYHDIIVNDCVLKHLTRQDVRDAYKTMQGVHTLLGESGGEIMLHEDDTELRLDMAVIGSAVAHENDGRDHIAEIQEAMTGLVKDGVIDPTGILPRDAEGNIADLGYGVTVALPKSSSGNDTDLAEQLIESRDASRPVTFTPSTEETVELLYPHQVQPMEFPATTEVVIIPESRKSLEELELLLMGVDTELDNIHTDELHVILNSLRENGSVLSMSITIGQVSAESYYRDLLHLLRLGLIAEHKSPVDFRKTLRLTDLGLLYCMRTPEVWDVDMTSQFNVKDAVVLNPNDFEDDETIYGIVAINRKTEEALLLDYKQVLPMTGTESSKDTKFQLRVDLDELLFATHEDIIYGQRRNW